MSKHSVLHLPPPLRRKLETTLAEFVYASPASPADFASPAGEPALLRPDSVSWQVFSNPVTVFIGGVTAVLLELAEPRVRTGVWEHTTFRFDPVPRLRRTGHAAMMTVYGPASRARGMIAGVGRRHARISGLTPDGQAYRADDPVLLDWVQATAGFGFLEAYCAFARPLSAAERDGFYAESRMTAPLYGAHGAPVSQDELMRLFVTMEPALEASPIVTEFLGIMRSAPILPAVLAPMQGWLLAAAASLLPQWVRERLGLSALARLPAWQRRIIRTMAGAADRVMLTNSPAVVACRRLNLPDDYLYRLRGVSGSIGTPS